METWMYYIIGGCVVLIIGLFMFMNRPKRVKVRVTDQFGNERVYGATFRDGKVIFRHNEASKAGVAVEGNGTYFKKRGMYSYLDIEGVLLPVSVQKYETPETRVLLDLSTAQEKLYEADALRAVIKKINNSWWENNKHIVLAIFIIVIAGILFWLTLHYANKIEPVPQPMYDLANACVEALRNVSTENSHQFNIVLQEYTRQTGQTIGGVPQ